jgi:carboxyl-terminal processing protease
MRTLILFVLIITTITYSNAQTNSAADQIFYVKRVIEKYHLQPKPIDDNFSSLLYKDFIQAIDVNKLYFTTKAIAELEKLEKNIDDDINNKKLSFLNTITPIYKKQLNTVISYIDAIALLPCNFTLEEIIKDYSSFATNDEQLKERWRIEMKAATLEALCSYAINSNNKAKLTDKQWMKDQEVIIRKKQAQKLKGVIQEILQTSNGVENDLTNIFCEKMAEIFDPHTNYFTPRALGNFKNSLSGGQKIIFGFSIDKNDKGELIIGNLEPGSPAYKSGQLHINDILVSLTTENNTTVKFADITDDEANELFERVEGTIMLTVKKNDGVLATVTLTEAKVSSEDGLVQSFILKENINIGYIALPDFYTGTDNFVNQGCAADVAKEIIKLKKENIQGLVLDLRYNGGGSLQEAIELAGIFIDEGPLVLTKNSLDNKTIILRDKNRGTIYDGPLMLLLNGYSASASEILASMLQDYNRAYTVGNKTFGKHIGQVIIPLDTVGTIQEILSRTSVPKYGYVKVTTSQYNNLKGKTLQGIGIVPQIQLPTLTILEESEAKLPHPITVQDLVKEVSYKPMPVMNTSLLNENSAKRIAANKIMQETLASIKKIKLGNLQPQTLKLTTYLAQQFTTEKVVTPIKLFNVDNTAFYKERLKVNQSLIKDNDAIKEYLSQDLIIREAFEIYKNILNIK